ncbi:MAG: metallophosphoesterase family protein [Pseudomonadota bacterium]
MNFDDAKPILVFGGPYSNLQATQAMLQEAQRLQLGPEQIICTGDVVAYAANPEETTKLIRDWGIHVVAGNCEEQLAEGAEDCGCGFEEGSVCDLLSRGWYPFALSQISAESQRWMADLPKSMRFNYCGLDVQVLHGGRAQTNKFIFGSNEGILEEETEAIDADLVLAGHAGIPFISRTKRATWLNAGVIGIPANDGTPDVWYALLEPITSEQQIQVSLKRLAYDHISAAAAMRKSGHANGYARSIVTGVWPSHDILPQVELGQTGKKLRQKTQKISAPEKRARAVA